MKTQLNLNFASLTTIEMINLVKPIQETLATGFNSKKSKTFSSADLWNIQKQKRSFIIR